MSEFVNKVSDVLSAQIERSVRSRMAPIDAVVDRKVAEVMVKLEGRLDEIIQAEIEHRMGAIVGRRGDTAIADRLFKRSRAESEL